MEGRLLRSIFHWLNKFFMVPAYRLGLGSWISNPLTGYIMVIKSTGRKSGVTRYAPVNYALIDGNIYCVSGFGTKSDWYYNVQANPRIEVILPGTAVTGVAEEVVEADECLRATRQIMKNAGFAGFLLGFNPFTASDEEVRQKCQGYPVLRIRPAGVGNSPSDPGGWLWMLVWLVGFAWLVRRRRRD